MKWKSISGYEGVYEVSDTGLVRSFKNGRERILSPRKQRRGYLAVSLHKDRKRKHMLVHRLVAAAFIPNPLGLKTVNHKDEDKTNNEVANLEWLSLADNIRYSKDKPVCQLDKLGNVVGQFSSVHEAGRQTGIFWSSIWSVCRGIYKTAGGYSWRYA